MYVNIKENNNLRGFKSKIVEKMYKNKYVKSFLQFIIISSNHKKDNS